MSAQVMFSISGRRKLRRLLEMMLRPKGSVRNYGFDALGPLAA